MKFKGFVLFVIGPFLACSCSHKILEKETFYSTQHTWVETIITDPITGNESYLRPETQEDAYKVVYFYDNARYARFYKGNSLLLETLIKDVYWDKSSSCYHNDPFCYELNGGITICRSYFRGDTVQVHNFPWFDGYTELDCQHPKYRHLFIERHDPPH